MLILLESPSLYIKNLLKFTNLRENKLKNVQKILKIDAVICVIKICFCCLLTDKLQGKQRVYLTGSYPDS